MKKIKKYKVHPRQKRIMEKWGFVLNLAANKDNLFNVAYWDYSKNQALQIVFAATANLTEAEFINQIIRQGFYWGMTVYSEESMVNKRDLVSKMFK